MELSLQVQGQQLRPLRLDDLQRDRVGGPVSGSASRPAPGGNRDRSCPNADENTRALGARCGRDDALAASGLDRGRRELRGDVREEPFEFARVRGQDDVFVERVEEHVRVALEPGERIGIQHHRTPRT